LSALKSLRIELALEIEGRFRAQFLASLSSTVSNIGNILSGIQSKTALSAQTAERLTSHADHLREILKQSPAYGFGIIPSVLVGYSVLIPSMKIVGITPAEIEATRKSFLDEVFGPALDPGRNGSFAFLQVQSDRLKRQLIEQVKAGMKKTTLGLIYESIEVDPWAPYFRFKFKTTKLTATFTGDPEDPETIGATEISQEIAEEGQNAITIFYSNVSPPPITGAVQAFTLGDAKIVRSDWIGQYKSWSQEANSEGKISSDLQTMQQEIRKQISE
jgi:hypothetical protein